MKKNIKFKKTINNFNKIISKNRWYVLFGLCLIIPLLILIITSNILDEKYKNSKSPSITLIGERYINLKVGEKYEEPGVKADDGKGNDISKDVLITGNVDVTKEGTYYLFYNVKNRSGVKADQEMRAVTIGEIETEEVEKGKGKNETSEQYNNIIDEVLEEYGANLKQFDETCKKVDYIYPIVLDYFEEDEEPEREELRPLIKAAIEEKKL